MKHSPGPSFPRLVGLWTAVWLVGAVLMAAGAWAVCQAWDIIKYAIPGANG